MVSDTTSAEVEIADDECLNPCSNGIWSLTGRQSCKWMTSMCLNPCSNGIWSLTSNRRCCPPSQWTVLILVLMEYGLWQKRSERWELRATVLILVLMEYGLWLDMLDSTEIKTSGLNPCSNGIWSLTWDGAALFKLITRVLILVLMEYGLWREVMNKGRKPVTGLNPCSNGIWSLTAWGRRYDKTGRVLILVLMEYGLWPVPVRCWTFAGCLS